MVKKSHKQLNTAETPTYNNSKFYDAYDAIEWRSEESIKISQEKDNTTTKYNQFMVLKSEGLHIFHRVSVGNNCLVKYTFPTLKFYLFFR